VARYRSLTTGLPSSHASGVQEASPEGWQESIRRHGVARSGVQEASPEGWRESIRRHGVARSGVQEASPEGWQEISPGWSASDTRGCSFNANRTPEGCEDNLGRTKIGNWTNPASQIRKPRYRIGPSNVILRISDLRCRIRPISDFLNFFVIITLLALCVFAFPGCRKNTPVVVTPAATPAPPPAATPAYAVALESGNRAFAASDYTGAVRDYERYLQLVPFGGDREDVLIRLGLIHALPAPEVYDWPRATSLFKQLASEFPSSPWRPVSQLVMSLRDQTTSLAAEVQTMKSDAARIQTQIESLRSNSAEQSAQIVKLQKDAEMLKDEIGKRDQKIKDLNSDLQRLIRIDSRTQGPPK